MTSTKQAFTNLPVQLSHFIGRDHARAEIKPLIWSARLLTLIGPGGCGKTRLALKIANELLDAFQDGVWFIELAPLADAALIPRTIMSALDIPEQSGRALADTLTNQLRPRELLLVLDNCEHLIAGCAELVVTLLRHCPALKILATSREALNLTGEMTWTVPPLSMIDPQSATDAATLQTSEAACLFLDRASAAQSDFAVSDPTAPAIAQICQRLDGMPLAIELAAARVRALTVDQIAARLDNRFSLLSFGDRTAPARHQTLRAMIDWSYGLLDRAEKTLFRRLAIFSGGWSLEAAEAVCADGDLAVNDVLAVLSRLVDKSLVIVDRSHSTARYHFLETIRQYALEKLVEAAEVDRLRGSHLAYFIQWAETAESHLHTRDQLSWLARYETDHDNLRAALDWSQSDHRLATEALHLVAACGRFWRMHGYFSEGRQHLSKALASSDAQDHTATRARALNSLAHLMYLQSDYPAMRPVADEAYSIWRELGAAGRSGMAFALGLLGELATEEGDYDRAPHFLEEALEIYRELGDTRGVGEMYMQLGWASMRVGDYPRAAEHLGRFLTLAQQVGDPHLLAFAYSGLGEVAVRQGQYDRAVSWLEQGLALNRDRGDKWGVSTLLGSLGWVALRQRDFDRMRDRLSESISIRTETGDKGGLAWCLEKLAEAACLQGRTAIAVEIFGAAAALRTPLGSVIDPADRLDYDRLIAELRSTLGDKAFAANWAKGEAASLNDTIAAALAEPDRPLKPIESAKDKSRGLTAREREVAALIAHGKTNREIAETLVVELKTVETHITHILNKLGFENRVQIATWAVNHGLANPPTPTFSSLSKGQGLPR